MSRFTRTFARAAATVLLGLLTAASASGQTSAGGLFGPWRKDRDFEFTAQALLREEGQLKGTDADVTIQQYDVFGRWRLDDSRKLNPTLGFAHLQLDVDLPGDDWHLADQSIGFGSPLYQFQNGWFIAAAAGIGYAGNEPYGDANAYYGKGTFILGTELGPGETLIFVVDLVDVA